MDNHFTVLRSFDTVSYNFVELFLKKELGNIICLRISDTAFLHSLSQQYFLNVTVLMEH